MKQVMSKNGIAKKIPALCLVGICVLLFCGGNELRLFSRKFFRIDTVTTVTVSAPVNQEDAIEVLWHAVDSLLMSWEKRFSITHPESEVLVLNTRQQDTMPISPMLGEMLARGLRYGDTLQGLFDLTVLPVKELWGFGEKADPGDSSFVIPDSSRVKEVLKLVNYKEIFLDSASEKVIFKDSGTRIDVGGIAKGFVLREIAALIEGLGFSDYLVVAGGDIVAGGMKPGNKPWYIAIQHPRNPQALLAALPLDSGSIVTSGDYERYFIKDSVRYHHIFNPETGYSCRENQSVTIWSSDPIDADILSTGLFCLKAASILDFVENRPNLECLVVDSIGKTHVSQGLVSKLEWFQ